jgi:hypothetical protein
LWPRAFFSEVGGGRASLLVVILLFAAGAVEYRRRGMIGAQSAPLLFVAGLLIAAMIGFATKSAAIGLLIRRSFSRSASSICGMRSLIAIRAMPS